MKTLNKKILTVCLALMMAVVMAVPAFARAEGQYSASSRYYRFHVGDYATFLNLTGNVGATLNMRRLSLYRTNAPGADQNFRRVYVRNGLPVDTTMGLTVPNILVREAAHTGT